MLAEDSLLGFKNLFINSPFARILGEHPISFFDVGARRGFDSDLHPIAFGVDAIGFEPNSLEYQRLRSEKTDLWRSTLYLPYAIGEENSKRALHIPSDPEGASLLPPLKDLPQRFAKDQFFRIIDTEEVNTVTLDYVLSNNTLSGPDYLKIDIEGLELQSLKNSPQTLAGLLAIKTEVAFQYLRENQPLAWEMDAFLRDQGFMLMDVIGPAKWRNHGHVTHPHMSDEDIPYSRGQLIHGDYIFFRDPMQSDLTAEEKFKLGCIAMSLGFFDFAEELFCEANVKDLAGFENVSQLRHVLAKCSRRYGRVTAKQTACEKLVQLKPFIRRMKNLFLK